jgi:hypothetical protein
VLGEVKVKVKVKVKVQLEPGGRATLLGTVEDRLKKLWRWASNPIA